MDRLQLLENWLQKQFPKEAFVLEPASADASFRRYFRVKFDDETFMAMDAPPQNEDCAPFMHIAQLLAETVHVPKILTSDQEQGFLLLSDLGHTTYLQALSHRPENANDLYTAAIESLIKMQLTVQLDGLSHYDENLLRYELNLFPDWYITRHLQMDLTSEQRTILEQVFAKLLRNNLSQPKVFVHRDYHSRNLMVTVPNPGILDFQDAVLGPVTYDLASLLKDAYISWDEEQILDWAIRYWEKARQAGLPVTDDFGEFYRDFEWMGVQRHIKILGIFARLFYRDGKHAYLHDMPQVITYLRKTCERYQELRPLLKLMDEMGDNEPKRKIGYTF